MLYKGLDFSFKQGLQGIVIKFLLNIKFSVLYSTRINVEGTYLTTFSWWTRVAFNFQGYLMGRVKLEGDIFGTKTSYQERFLLHTCSSKIGGKYIWNRCTILVVPFWH